MSILATIATLGYAFVNAFGTWMVVRRKPWVAGLFMFSATVLMIAFAGFLGVFPYNLSILAAGLLLASVSSLINARIVLGRVVWKHHLIRAAAGLIIFLLAYISR
jgi:hypothetical protein